MRQVSRTLGPMVPWIHVASLTDAAGEDGWIIVPTRAHPSFARMLEQLARGAVRRFPAIDGWWVAAHGTNALFAALDYSTPTHEVCAQCAAENTPCEHALATALARSYAFARAEIMLAAMRERQGREQDAAREAWAWREHNGPSYRTTRYEPFVPPPRTKRAPPPPVVREDPVVKARAAASVLGLDWPATHAEVQKAFRREIMRAHTDRGGTDAAAVSVIQARKTLLEALA